MYYLVIFIFTLTIHECAHGYIAYKMGDPTARNMGRLTLNPIRHIDPIGFILLMFFSFGWAKPVMINPRYFKNPKRGMAISAAAGPLSNLIMAFFGVVIYRTVAIVVIKNGLFVNTFALSALDFLSLFAVLNVYFAVFNLIPLPPLDGSRIVSYMLPRKLGYYYNQIERYGFLILIMLLNADRVGLNIRGGLGWISTQILSGIDFILNPIFSLFGG